MKEPLDHSYGLINKAVHDLQAAEIGIQNEAPLDTVAFQVQYPKTHALGALLDLAVPHEADLEGFRERLLVMSSYAVEMRYDDEVYPTDDEITVGIQVARELNARILSLLPPQKTNPPAPVPTIE